MPDLTARTLWYRDISTDERGESYDPTAPGEEAPDEVANLVSSRCHDGLHRPALDFDFPVTVVESSTPGHHHVYLERPLEWEQYQRLIQVLGDVGLLEPGYVKASLEREMTMLRRPGVSKAVA